MGEIAIIRFRRVHDPNVRCWRLKVLNATESAALAFMKQYYDTWDSAPKFYKEVWLVRVPYSIYYHADLHQG